MNEDMRKDIKDYFKFFCIPFIILAVIAVLLICFTLSKTEDVTGGYYDSPNTERVYGSQRVFDYAGLMSEQEIADLEEYISYMEKEVCTDIVIVTLYEPLENYEPEYRSRYNIPITPDKWVMVYADKFWEDNKFGYDRPQILDGTPNSGDGVILVDNNYREGPDDRIYTWLGTTGKAERELSSSEIDTILDAFYYQVDYDYYSACIDFVNKYVETMNPSEGFRVKDINPVVGLVIAIIASLIFVACNWRAKAARITVTPTTYVVGNAPSFTVKSDTFLRKTVQKVRVSSSSGSSGGGGHHSSGGGGSHGGGGHSR